MTDIKIKLLLTMKETNGFFYLHHMTNEKAVAEKLLEIQAIKLNLETPFIWASGWKSPIYCDNRKTLSFPHIREFIKSEMCNRIFEEFPDADYLAGVATAGIAWGAMAADQLKLPFIYVRSKPKEHGMGNQIEGFYEIGKQVVVIEDLISTGKSSLSVVHALRAAGLNIAGLVSIFNYGFDEAANAFTAEGVKTRSLTDYLTLIGLAVEKGAVSAVQLETLVKWREDPANWKAVSYF
jgi:orotate phosphoribosyltransferase